MELAAECLCPLGIEPGPVMVVHKRHRHGCHALERWKGKPTEGVGGGES